MAHPEQAEFIQSCFKRFSLLVDEAVNILEIGSQDISGTVRDYPEISGPKNWLGLDLGPGKHVDFVIPGELIQLPEGWADISLSTECFEHAKSWDKVLLNMIRCTRSGGLLVLTFGGSGRAAHGTIDTEEYLSPYTNDYYANISLQDFAAAIDLGKYFYRYSLEVHSGHGDTYFWGIRNSHNDETEYLPLEESLARARGQLGRVISANRELERQVLLCNSPLLSFYKLIKYIQRKVYGHLSKSQGSPH